MVEIDQARIDRRIASGYCDETTDNLDDAINKWIAARDAGQPLALALRANAADVLPTLLERGILAAIAPVCVGICQVLSAVQLN